MYKRQVVFVGTAVMVGIIVVVVLVVDVAEDEAVVTVGLIRD